MNGRRTLLCAMGAGLVAPRFLLAQQAQQMTVVVLFAGESDDDEPAVRPFFDEMRRLGWVEGKNIVYERLSGRGTREYVDRLAQFAVGLAPHLIYATSGTTALAAAKATDTIPVAFTSASDPVANGLVASLAKPGRNVTGVYQNRSDAIVKRYALVREVLPHLKRVGAIFDRRAGEYQRQRASHQEAARQAGFELAAKDFTNYEAVAKILANFRREGIIAVSVATSFTLIARRREVCARALRNDIALIAHRADWAEAGALMTYGADVGESLRLCASIAHRILKGARPSVTPVEQVSKLELVVNQRTARALQIDVPQTVLLRVDRVIE